MGHLGTSIHPNVHVAGLPSGIDPGFFPRGRFCDQCHHSDDELLCIDSNLRPKIRRKIWHRYHHIIDDSIHHHFPSCMDCYHYNLGICRIPVRIRRTIIFELRDNQQVFKSIFKSFPSGRLFLLSFNLKSIEKTSTLIFDKNFPFYLFFFLLLHIKSQFRN